MGQEEARKADYEFRRLRQIHSTTAHDRANARLPGSGTATLLATRKPTLSFWSVGFRSRRRTTQGPREDAEGPAEKAAVRVREIRLVPIGTGPPLDRRSRKAQEKNERPDGRQVVRRVSVFAAFVEVRVSRFAVRQRRRVARERNCSASGKSSNRRSFRRSCSTRPCTTRPPWEGSTPPRAAAVGRRATAIRRRGGRAPLSR